MPADPVIKIRGLCKRYRIQRGWKDALLHPWRRDIRVALDGIDLDVHQGQFFGVLGQNGAGKTTLFKILATLIRPDSGLASVAGLNVVEDPAGIRRLLVPVIPTDRSLYWRVSAEENLRLYASLYGLRRADASTRIRELLELVGLEDVGQKQVGLFSSGMKQRLLIARALLGQPEILLLDEPTRSLDPLSSRDFRAFLRRQVREGHKLTVLLATHDHEEVTELCDRVAVLDQGRLLAVGQTEVLLASSKLKAYSLWTPEPRHPALASSIESAGGRLLSIEPVAVTDGTGWSRVTMEIPTNEAGTANLLGAIANAGIPVSRFSRDGMSLADLLERVKAERDPRSGDKTG